jgi:hypothetical protein
MIAQDATTLLIHHGGMNVGRFNFDHHGDPVMLD